MWNQNDSIDLDPQEIEESSRKRSMNEKPKSKRLRIDKNPSLANVNRHHRTGSSQSGIIQQRDPFFQNLSQQRKDSSSQNGEKEPSSPLHFINHENDDNHKHSFHSEPQIRNQSPFRIRRKSMPEKLQSGEWVENWPSRNILEIQNVEQKKSNIEDENEKSRDHSPLIQTVKDPLFIQQHQQNLQNKKKTKITEMHSLSPIQSMNNNKIVYHDNDLLHDDHLVENSQGKKKSHKSIFEPSILITNLITKLFQFFLFKLPKTIRYLISFTASIPLIIVSWVTRFYVSLSLAVIMNFIYMIRKFFYFGFVVWILVGFSFCKSFVLSVWSWLKYPFRSNTKKKISKKEHSRTVEPDNNSNNSSNHSGNSKEDISLHHLKQKKQSRNKSNKITTREESNAIRDLFHIMAPSKQYKYVVHIPEGRFIPHDKKYRILMKEKQNFSIILCNDDSKPCCCVILVNGKHVGNVKMASHSFGALDRSAYTGRPFSFVSKKQNQLRKVYSMESINRSDNDDVLTDVISNSALKSKEEPIRSVNKDHSQEFTVEVIFCPLDESFWNRYKKLLIGYSIAGLFFYRFMTYIPSFILYIFFMITPITFIFTYLFFFKQHQRLVMLVLGFFKQLNEKFRYLIFGTEDGPILKYFDVQQYIGDEDLNFDSNDSVTVNLTLIPMHTHSNVVQKHREEHERIHSHKKEDSSSISENGKDFKEIHTEVITKKISPLAGMIQSTPSRLSEGIKNFISSQRLISRKLPSLPINCWKHILSFLDTNSVEFFKMRFVSFQLQKIVDEKVFQELEKSQKIPS